MHKDKMTNEQIAIKVSVTTIIGNIFLSVFKLFAVIFVKSSAMLSDAVHSISDVVSTLVVIVGAKMSAKYPYEKHQYGHERMECVSAIILWWLTYYIHHKGCPLCKACSRLMVFYMTKFH